MGPEGNIEYLILIKKVKDNIIDEEEAKEYLEYKFSGDLPEYTDLIKIELNGNYAVTDEGIVSCGAAAVFNSECEYQGFQWKAGTLFNILDDLKLALNLGQFYGDDSETNKTFVNLNVTFNF